MLNIYLIGNSKFRTSESHFFMVIREDETLSSIKERIQKKLKVPDEDFSKVMPISLSN